MDGVSRWNAEVVHVGRTLYRSKLGELKKGLLTSRWAKMVLLNANIDSCQEIELFGELGPESLDYLNSKFLQGRIEDMS